MLRTLPGILLLCTLPSCVQPIELNNVDVLIEPKPVLFGVLEVNEAYRDILRFTQTGQPGNPSPIFTYKKVVCRSAGGAVGEARRDTAGYLIPPPDFPLPGQPYTVEVELSLAENLMATADAPSPVNIHSYSYVNNDGTLNQDGLPNSRLEFTIDDPPGEENYYEVVLFFFSPSQRRPYGFVGFSTYTDNPNAVLTREGDQAFNPSTLFFSDELFDGRSLKFVQQFENYSTSGDLIAYDDFGLTEGGTYLLFRSINRPYYDFLKSWTRHRYTQELAGGFGSLSEITSEGIQDVLFSPELTPVYSNVVGGLGVVGAVHTQIIRIR